MRKIIGHRSVKTNPPRSLAQEQFANMGDIADLVGTNNGLLIGGVNRLRDTSVSAMEAQHQKLNHSIASIARDLNTKRASIRQQNSLATTKRGQVSSLHNECDRLNQELTIRRRGNIVESRARFVCNSRWWEIFRWLQAPADFLLGQLFVKETPKENPIHIETAFGNSWNPVSDLSTFPHPPVVISSGAVKKIESRIKSSRRLAQQRTNEIAALESEATRLKQSVEQMTSRLALLKNQRVQQSQLIANFKSRDASMRWNGDGHVITFAPTGAGKGTGVVVPNLLTYTGSTMCIDLKGTNYAITCNARKSMGQQVGLLDPFGVVRRLGIDAPTASINPLALIDPNDDNWIDNARTLAAAIVPPSGSPEEAYLFEGAQELLAGIMLHVISTVPPEGRNLIVVKRMLSRPPEKWKQLLKTMGESKHADGIIANAVNGFLQYSPNAAGNILGTLRRNTKFLDSRAVQSCCKKNQLGNGEELNLANIRDRGEISLYLVIPEDKIEVYSPLLRLWISCLTTGLIRANRPPSKRVLFMLDEVAQLGRMPELLRAMTIMRERGLTLWFIYQDLAQLQSAYPTEWPSFFSNTAVKQFFGISDLETAERVSRTLGETTIHVTSHSRSQSSGRANATSQNQSTATGASLGSSIVNTHGDSHGRTSGRSGENAISTSSYSSSSGQSIGRSQQRTNNRSVGYGATQTNQSTMGDGVSKTPTTVALITPSELRRMDGSTMLVICENRRPIQATKIPYFQDSRFEGKFDPNPLVEREGRVRVLPKPRRISFKNT